MNNSTILLVRLSIQTAQSHSNHASENNDAKLEMRTYTQITTNTTCTSYIAQMLKENCLLHNSSVMAMYMTQ